MRNFIEITPKLWQSLYQLYKDHKDDQADCTKRISTILEQYSFSPDLASSTAASLFGILSKSIPSLPQEVSADDNIAYLSLMDIKILSECLAEETDINVCRLLVAFAIYFRAAYHPSGWIKYDRQIIFYLAGLTKLSNMEKESLTKYLHQKYELNMQVVGSTQPIPCFNLAWMSDQPPVSEETDNPLVQLGDLSPTTISTYIYTVLEKGKEKEN